MKIKVDCYSGYRTEEKPRKFWIKDREINISKIISQWISPESRNFEVLGHDNNTYKLRMDARTWQWELMEFKAEPA